ncbi:MAG: hypothetical protein ACP5IT_09820 [Thermoproteota archaeon]|jgi:hypothetical protein
MGLKKLIVALVLIGIVTFCLFNLLVYIDAVFVFSLARLGYYDVTAPVHISFKQLIVGGLIAAIAAVVSSAVAALIAFAATEILRAEGLLS